MASHLATAALAALRSPRSSLHLFCQRSFLKSYSISFLLLYYGRSTLVIVSHADKKNFWFFEEVTALVDEVENLTAIFLIFLEATYEDDNKLTLYEKILHILLVVIFSLGQNVSNIVLYHAKYFLRVRKIFNDECVLGQLQLC